MGALLLTSLAVVLSATACNAGETDRSFCADVNAQRKICERVKVHCGMILENSSPDLVEKIRQCPISASMDMMPPSGKHPDIGYIPCCVSAGEQP